MGMGKELEAICDAEVQSLLQKKGIEIVLNLISVLLAVFLLSLKERARTAPSLIWKVLTSILNTIISYTPTRFFTKIDVKDAYLTIPIFHEHKKCLHIRWKVVFYQFISLCFGLASAPWAFTNLLKPVVAFCRKRGIRLIIIFLDDILILNESKSGAEKDFELVVSIPERCGFLIDREKSAVEATRKIEYLGMIAVSHFFIVISSGWKSFKYC